MAIELIELLPPKVQKSLFERPYRGTDDPGQTAAIAKQIQNRMGLKETKVPWVTSEFPDTGHSARPLLEQFAHATVGTRLKALERLAKTGVPQPPRPEKLVVAAGWMRYSTSGTGAVKWPLEPCVLFDCETFVKAGNYPLMAVAASTDAYYIWLHPCLVTGEPFRPLLIPMGTGTTIVAHNVKFDIARCAEHWKASPVAERLMGICTMSMAMSQNGMGGSKQRAYAASIAKKLRLNEGYFVPEWYNKTVGGSLKACYEFYTRKDWGDIDKSLRDIFVEAEEPGVIRENLLKLLEYNLNDVAKTGGLFKVLWQRNEVIFNCESDVPIASMLLESANYFKVSNTWDTQVVLCESAYLSKKHEVTELLKELAGSIVQKWQAGKLDPQEDPWLKQLDWKILGKTAKRPGYPKWWSSKKVDSGLSITSSLVPLLLRLTWSGFPLYYHKSQKWGFYVDGKYCKVPHPKGDDENCGSPMGKSYLPFLESGTLASDSEDSEVAKLFEAAKAISYWKSYSSRFTDNPRHFKHGDLISPGQYIWGTLSLRQVEALWLTMCQAKPNRIGSEMMHLVEPLHEDWVCIGADFDTQEVRIAATFGDHLSGKVIASNCMSQSAWKGRKEDGDDPHTLLAVESGVDRQDGKTANFRIIYGGGKYTVTMALKAAHLDWSMQKCEATAARMLLAKKGQKNRSIGWHGGTDSQAHNYMADFADNHTVRPMLGTIIPESIWRSNDPKGEFYTSRFNNVTQGTGSDIRASFNVVLEYLSNLCGIPHVQMLWRHDEVWYTVPQRHLKTFGACMNLAHMIVWAALFESLGMNQAPAVTCGFSAINVDRTIRKEVNYGTTSISGGREIQDGYYLKPEDLSEETEHVLRLLQATDLSY